MWQKIAQSLKPKQGPAAAVLLPGRALSVVLYLVLCKGSGAHLLSAPNSVPVRLRLRVSGSLSPRTFLGCSVTCLVSSCFFVVVTGFFWFVFVFPIVGLVLKSCKLRLSTTQSPFWKHSELCQGPRAGVPG